MEYKYIRIYAVLSVVNVHLEIILIRKFQSSNTDLFSSNSSCARKLKSLIGMHLLTLEGNWKLSVSDELKSTQKHDL